MFGTKPIVCLLKGGKIMVRVGGGFMSLKEYIEKHSAEESEKMLRKIEVEEKTGTPMSFRRLDSKGKIG